MPLDEPTRQPKTSLQSDDKSSFQNYTVHKDLPYTSSNTHPRQVLDLYVPNQTPISSRSLIPVILYIHGGAFAYGDKSDSPHLPLRQVKENNYAIAAINYRRSGEAPFPAMIQDCKSGIRFLKSPTILSKFNLDPERIVAWGESAGGHAAAFCGTTSNSFHGEWDVHANEDASVIGVVDYYGPSANFLEMDRNLPPEWATHNGSDSPESRYLAGHIVRPEMVDKLRMADPRTYIPELVQQKDKVPNFFVAHGVQDRIVPEAMSSLFVRALRDAGGVEVEYFPVEGADHGFRGITEEQQRELDQRTDAFLKKLFER